MPKDDLDALERKKRELELRRDIAHLQRNEEIRSRVSNVTSNLSLHVSNVTNKVTTGSVWSGRLSWWWIVPLSALGGYLILGGLFDGPKIVALIGAVFLLPACMKIWGKR